MQRVSRLVHKLEEIISYITIVAIFLMMILITATTLRRAIFGLSIEGVYKFSTMYLLPTLVMLSFAKLHRDGDQISVELLSDKLPTQILRIRDILYQLLLAGILVVMIHLTGEIFWENFLDRATASGSAIAFPVYVSNFIVPLGFTILLMRIIISIVLQTKKLRGGSKA